MSGSSSTSLADLDYYEDVVVSAGSSASDYEPGLAVSSSSYAGHVMDRMRSAVLPLLATGAALAWRPSAVQRVWIAAPSTTKLMRADWLSDEFVMTEERVTLDEVLALNALLTIPVVEGFGIDWDD